jgi:hypothetical protein
MSLQVPGIQKAKRNSRRLSGVRGSSFRHTFAETVPQKETFYNVHVAIPGPRAIKANSKRFVVPWSQGVGGFAVFDLDAPGKQEDSFPYIGAHKSSILAIDISQEQEGLVLTGAREPVVKLWDVSTHTRENRVTEPILEFVGHGSRITSLEFNPNVSGLFLSSSGDKTIKLWDQETADCLYTLTGATGDYISTAWSEKGDLILTSAKDNAMRIFDPRQGETASMQKPKLHSSTKGFEVCWMDPAATQFCSVGWKGGDREISLWDVKNLDKPFASTIVDQSSSTLSPYFDSGTGLLYLVEKGALTHYFEVTKTKPFLFRLSKYSSPTTHTSACLLPKRNNDVMKSEVARFLMADKERVEVVKFFVPRKAGKLFQEDLFPPVVSGKASQSLNSWTSGETKAPIKISLKPENVKSVYEVSLEDGGRSRTVDEQTKAGKTQEEIDKAMRKAEEEDVPLTEGPLQILQKGWLWNAYQPTYVRLKKKAIYCFPTADTAAPTEVIQRANIASVSPSPSDDVSFEVVRNKGNAVGFKAHSTKNRMRWVEAMRTAPRCPPPPPVRKIHLLLSISPALPAI